MRHFFWTILAAVTLSAAALSAPVVPASPAPAGPLVLDFGGASPDAPVAGLDQWQRGFPPPGGRGQGVAGTKNVVVLRVYFHDYTANSRYTKAQVEGFFNTDLNNLWQDVSYGKIDVHAQVTDLYQLPHNRSYYVTDHSDGDLSDGDQFDHVVLDSIADSPSGIDWSNVDAVFVVMAETSSSQFHRGQAGKGNVPMGPGGDIKNVGVGIFSENPSDGDTAVWGRWAHELGHAFQVAGPAHPSNYNSYFELMDHNMPGQSGVFEKQDHTGFPGWLPAAKYQEFTPSSGGGTAVIWAEEHDPSGKPNIQAVKVTITGSLYYLVSVRRRINGDELLPDFGIPGIPDEGVLIERVSEGSDPWVTVQGNGGNRDKLWHQGETYTNASDNVYINVTKKVDDDNYQITVRYNDKSYQPDVMIDPWTSPPGNTWETTDIWVDSPVNGFGVFRYGMWNDLSGNPVPVGNGDDPAIGQQNRVYVRVRNTGARTATNVVVHVERTDPPGLGIAGADGWVPIQGSGTITSADFPALASLAAGAYTDVYINWTPNFTLTPEQIAEGTFAFHTCLRVRMDPVPFETVFGNQDGDREQENIQYFQADSAGASHPSKSAIRLHNDDKVNPKWFNLAYVSDLPPDWGLDVNGGKLSILLNPGEVREIPVSIEPKGPAVVGSTFGVDVSASFFRNLVNDENPKDKHMEFKTLGGVRVEARVLAPPKLHCKATQQAPRRIFVEGRLEGAPEFWEPNNPMFVMIEGVDVARHFLLDTARVLEVDKDGSFSGYLNGDVKDWRPYEVAVMFAGTTKLASALEFCPIIGVTPPRPGDVDGDGTVGLNDVSSILRIAGGLQTGLPGQVAAADFDGDNKLTVVDATRWATGIGLGRGGVVTLSSANAYSTYGVYLDDAGLNGHPEARVLATHRYVNHANGVIGVWYDAFAQRWVVYNEDISSMPTGEMFNYYYGPDVKSVTATGGSAVTLQTPALMLNADSVPLAIHDFVGAYATSPLAVDFTGTNWTALTENASPIPGNERVFFADARFHGGVATLTTSNAYSSAANAIGLYLDDPRLNGNPNAVVLAQHNRVAGSVPSPMGVWYSPSLGQWVVYDETFALLPFGEQVHYLIAP